MPEGIDEFNPNIHSPNLPVGLSQIVKDLDSINHYLNKNNVTLILSSFPMLAEDSLFENGLKYASVYSYWIHDFGKVPLSVIRRFNKFENLVLKKYAIANNVEFINIAEDLTKVPPAFIDGVHLSSDGLKLHAWSVFTQILPLIEKQISLNYLPQNRKQKDAFHPYISNSLPRTVLQLN